MGGEQEAVAELVVISVVANKHPRVSQDFSQCYQS